MPKGTLFWVLMVIWFFVGCYANRESLRSGSYVSFGGGLLLFALLFLLGWQVFGFVVQ